jgi:hypothetical protein
MAIYKAEKVKYEKFTKEKLQESTPKKHKFEKEPYNNKDKTVIIENDKENAPINKAKHQNGTVITDSTKN